MTQKLAVLLWMLGALLPLSAQETPPDLSDLDPDMTFVFSYSGDLYVTDFTGAPINLTQSEPYDIMPFWSPDGRHIAFLSGGTATFGHSLYIMTLDTGRIRKMGTFDDLTIEAEMAWSPDAKTIAVAQGDLILVNTQTGRQHTVPDPNSAQYPTWSPDGSQLAVEENARIYVLDADGGNPTQVTETQVNSWRPTWSPISQDVLFRAYPDKIEGLYTANMSDLTITSVIDLPDYVIYDYQWSPDGQQIALNLNAHEDSETDPTWADIYLINADGSDMRAISGDQYDDLIGWSRDGEQIFYWAGDPGGASGTFNAVRASDGTTTILHNPLLEEICSYGNCQSFSVHP